jgi:hypothetical protein
MANVPPPPQRNSKGLPPLAIEVKNNLSKPEPESIVALNFRVPAAFKKNFKIAAASHGITQSDLLKQAFQLWEKNNL